MMNVKQVQNDTLSHFILSRASLFSLASTGDLTYSSECLESSQIYVSNSQEVKLSNEHILCIMFLTAGTFEDCWVYRPSICRGEVYTGKTGPLHNSLPDHNWRCFVQIPEFVLFEDGLDNSLQRDLTKIEHVRMRVFHEIISPELIDSELVELKFLFDRCKS